MILAILVTCVVPELPLPVTGPGSLPQLALKLPGRFQFNKHYLFLLKFRLCMNQISLIFVQSKI